jgi:hypothetical protein
MSAERKYLADVPAGAQAAAKLIRTTGIIGGISLAALIGMAVFAVPLLFAFIAAYPLVISAFLLFVFICFVSAIILLGSGIYVKRICKQVGTPTSKIATRAIVLGSIGLGVIVVLPQLGPLIIGMTSPIGF